MRKLRLLRVATIPASIQFLLRGQLSFMSKQGFEVFAASADGEDVMAIENEGITHFKIPFTRTISPFQDFICLLKLIKLIRSLRPDLIHTHTPKAGLLGMLAAWICRVPVRLHTVAGLPMMESMGIKRSILMLTERITYSCATGVYPNSQGLLNYINSHLNIKSKKLKILARGSSNGIDTNYFSRTTELNESAKELRNQYGISDSVICFCFVGRLVRDKGLVELVEAFQKFCTNKQAKLLLVGSFEKELDPLPIAVFDFIMQNEDVIHVGFQKDVRPFIMASDIFVFPSYREGFPNVVMQAACLEVPVVASDINGCNEIIKHGETGLLVPVKNKEALHEAMLTLAEDHEMRKKFGDKSREFVVANFEQQFVWAEMLKEYKNLMTTK